MLAVNAPLARLTTGSETCLNNYTISRRFEKMGDIFATRKSQLREDHKTWSLCECEQLCRENAICRAFTFVQNGRRKNCFLKGKLGEKLVSLKEPSSTIFAEKKF